MTHQPAVLPQYFGAYVEYVCPLRPKTCHKGLRVTAPPLDVQQKRLDFLQELPPGLRGLSLELLDEGRVDELDYVQTHADDYQRFADLFASIED